MKHVMIDIETLGTKPGSIILSIGAVAFDLDTGATDITFYREIDPNSSQDAGMKLDFDTVKWWITKSAKAQQAIINNKGNKLTNVLIDFSTWLHYVDEEIYLWGNSARFDLGLIQGAYEVLGMPIPWNHYNELDVRTIVYFGREIKQRMPFSGVKHNALDDCFHQIKYVCEIYRQKIRNTTL